MDINRDSVKVQAEINRWVCDRLSFKTLHDEIPYAPQLKKQISQQRNSPGFSMTLFSMQLICSFPRRDGIQWIMFHAASFWIHKITDKHFDKITLKLQPIEKLHMLSMNIWLIFATFNWQHIIVVLIKSIRWLQFLSEYIMKLTNVKTYNQLNLRTGSLHCVVLHWHKSRTTELQSQTKADIFFSGGNNCIYANVRKQWL